MTDATVQKMRIDARTLFCNCLGVFQGGGVKAIAYAGAYEEARRQGIGFSHVAGTSAGAIFAALIAAGAQPDQLLEIARSEEIRRIPVAHYAIRCRNFASFAVAILIALAIIWFRYGWSLDFAVWGLTMILILGLSAWFIPGIKIITGIEEDFGYYDSSRIEATVDLWLRETLNLYDSKLIRFKDLPKHLTVYTCNVTNNSVTEWSSSRTPDASVAKVVAASCSIPLYFTPTKIYDKYHVDGGLLINRPDRVHDYMPNYFQALSFKLCSRQEPIKDIYGYIKALMSTLIDGADALQHTRTTYEDSTFGHDGVNDIDIMIEGVNATSFTDLDDSKIEYLLEAGRRGVRKFIDKLEHDLGKNGADSLSGSSNRTLYEEDYTYNQVAFWSYDKCDAIVVSDDTLDWVWPMFSTLLSWVSSGVAITVYYSHIPITSELKQRLDAHIRLLTALKITLHYIDPQDQIRGFFFKSSDKYKCILIDRKNARRDPVCKVYCSQIDSLFIKKVLKTITNINLHPISIHNTFRLLTIDPDIIRSKLQTIEVYKSHGVPSEIDYRYVLIKELWFIKQEVRSLKFKELRFIDDLYHSAGLSLYSPAEIEFSSSKRSMMTPIVVEEHDGKLVVIKGNARCYRAYTERDSQSRIPVFIVKTAPRLDDRPLYHVWQLFLSEKKNRGLAWLKPIRPIDQAFRPDSTYLI